MRQRERERDDDDDESYGCVLCPGGSDMSRSGKYWRTLRSSGRTSWGGKQTNLSSAGRNIALTSSASSMMTSLRAATTSGKEEMVFWAELTLH